MQMKFLQNIKESKDSNLPINGFILDNLESGLNLNKSSLTVTSSISENYINFDEKINFCKIGQIIIGKVKIKNSEDYLNPFKK